MFGRKPHQGNGAASGPSEPSAGGCDHRIQAFARLAVERTDTAAASARASGERHARGSPESARFFGAWSGLWLMLVVASLFGRSPWPTDETRLLAVAWEMWARGDFLLPTLNGVPWAQAPLTPWLIHAGWSVFGVAEGWARLVPALGALVGLILTGRLARLLWPQRAELAHLAPLVLLGTFAWSAATGFTGPHAWLAACVLFGLWAVAFSWRRRDHRAWLLTAGATALGLLAGGWVYLLYVYPVALLAPLWTREGRRPQWRYWYADVAKSLLLGAVPLLAWLVMVGLRHGATSVYELTRHAAPLPVLDLFLVRAQPWWYLVWLVPVFLPWSVWPVVWLRHWQRRRAPLNAGLLFCLVWVVASLVLLSLLPTKQPHGLLPLLPAGALVIAFLVLDEDLRSADGRPLASMTWPVVLLGAIILIAPALPRGDWAPEMLWQISPLVGLGLMVLGVALASLPVRATRRRLADLAAVSTLSVVLATLALGAQYDAHRRVTEIGTALNAMERDRRPIAIVGEYRGEFHFAGRLKRPIAVLSASRVRPWAHNHPDGVVVVRRAYWQPAGAGRVLLEARYGDDTITLWDAGSLLARGAEHAPDP